MKAFHEFGVPEAESDDSDGVRFLDVSSLFQEQGEEKHFFLPQQQRCSALTLNLIATNEVHKAGSNGPSHKLYRSAMAKCSSVWNKAHRSLLATEVNNMQFTIPSVTRWNSEFRAIAKVVGLPQDQLKDICDKLGVPMLYP